MCVYDIAVNANYLFHDLHAFTELNDISLLKQTNSYPLVSALLDLRSSHFLQSPK